MAARRETMKAKIARLGNEVHALATERAALFRALEDLTNANGTVAREPWEAARRVLGETCRCSCGRHVPLNARPRMCERCLST